jgi:S-formylglutathione hydrolase
MVVSQKVGLLEKPGRAAERQGSTEETTMTHREPRRQLPGLLLAALFLAGCDTTSANPTASPTAGIPTPTSTPVQASTTGQLLWIDVPAPSLEENLLGDPAQKQALVYLPASYGTSGRSYPVVYFLPGYSTDVGAFAYGTFRGFMLQGSTDRLIAAGTIGEMIVVIPEGQHVLGGSFYVNSSVSGNWEDFIVQDLVSYVDAEYRTISSADSRGISGHSMGGYGALNLAMLHPDVFGSVYSMSPGLFDEEGLANSQMFRNEATVDQFLALERELAGLSREEAHAEFIARSFGEDLAFTINYGMAFSPNPDRNAPYVEYPYEEVEGELVLDQEVWQAWEDGFGGIAEEVQTYRDNILALNAIALEYGTSDEYRWIPQGCEYFSEQLTAAGIEHQLVSFSGGHASLLGPRMESAMLPFFSEVLLSE